uniref:Redoxin family protein n=1 Tax=Janibacter limosus TaxID=53458 RepID=A0AC61U6K8_9MICO|nr:redoxin family protein [Janibacter limosus]
MATTAFKGNPVNTVGELPAPGATAPAFDLVGDGLSALTTADVPGRVVLNIFPSIDTGVCAASVRKFNELAASLDNTTVVNVSPGPPLRAGSFLRRRGHRQGQGRLDLPLLLR